MILRPITRTFAAAVVACAFVHGAYAQQQPSAAAVALATEILEIKGGISAFDPALDGVIAHHKGIFLQMNPSASKAIDEIEVDLRKDLATKRKALHEEVARGYATAFTEQELKEVLAFYKTPLGKKIIEAEPKGGEEAAKRVQVWVDKYADEVSNKMRAELKRKGFTEF